MPSTLAPNASFVSGIRATVALTVACGSTLNNSVVIKANGDSNTSNDTAGASTKYICLDQRLYLPLIQR